MLDKFNDVLTVKDLYEAIPIGKNAIYKLINDGKIKSIRVGKKIIIPKKEVINFLNL